MALLALPYLKLAGSALLLWIGIKLLVPEEGDGDVKASDNLVVAIRTILIADLVMSLDNVIAVAAAAGGHWALTIIGLAISIPMKLMELFPIIITIGAALIGVVAGEMAWEDRAIDAFTSPYPENMKYAAAAVCAVLVVAWGQWLAKRAQARAEEPHKISESNPAR